MPLASSPGAWSHYPALVDPYAVFGLADTPEEMHGQLLVVTNEFSGARQPNIQREIDLITRALRECSLIQVREATLVDLALTLTQHADAIVAAHFAGHGYAEGFVLNRSSSQRVYVLERELHAEMFADCKQLHCAFFNACFSNNVAASFQQSPAFSELFYTISVPGRIADEVAQTFTGVFYGQLAQKGEVEEAFTQGHALIKRAFPTLCGGLEGSPQLWIRPGTQIPRPLLRIGPPRTVLQFKVLLTMKNITDRQDYADDIRQSIIEELKAFQLTVREEHIRLVQRKTRWELRLDNSLDLIRTTEEQTQALMAAMKRAYGHDEIIFDSSRTGSLILCVSSSFETFQKMQARQDSGHLSKVLGMPVFGLAEVGVAADIVVPGYVYARLCAYQTACPEKDAAMRIGMPSAFPDLRQTEVRHSVKLARILLGACYRRPRCRYDTPSPLFVHDLPVCLPLVLLYSKVPPPPHSHSHYFRTPALLSLSHPFPLFSSLDTIP
eukprot:6173543-Pleurochrysis_carterae.AAC.3